MISSCIQLAQKRHLSRATHSLHSMQVRDEVMLLVTPSMDKQA